jgi:hypothetical protein
MLLFEIASLKSPHPHPPSPTHYVKIGLQPVQRPEYRQQKVKID